MISVKNLKKHFGPVIAVEDVSFIAGDGTVTGLLGPNGAGKTTSLRMIYGLVKPDTGTIHVDSHDVVTDTLTAQACLGVLPDQSGLYPRLTPREHIRYFGSLQNVPDDEIERRMEVWLDQLDLKKVADRRVGGFSHGERSKVAMARALIHNPQNIVLDEPTNGLDVSSTRAVRDVIRRLKSENRCVLFSSHVMQEVSALCDRIVVIARGRVVAEGTSDELLALTGNTNLEDAFVTLAGPHGEAA